MNRLLRPRIWLPGGPPIFTVSRQQFMNIRASVTFAKVFLGYENGLDSRGPMLRQEIMPKD
jgi:hypothetical protein